MTYSQTFFVWHVLAKTITVDYNCVQDEVFLKEDYKKTHLSKSSRWFADSNCIFLAYRNKLYKVISICSFKYCNLKYMTSKLT